MSRHKKAIILFTRVPIPGKTKTRLMPYFTGQQCARLHTCILKDLRKECEKTDADCRVYFTPQDQGAVLKKILGEKMAYFPQQGETLGEKMQRALEETLECGYESCLLFGTDIPELRGEDFAHAFRILENRDVVFGPSEDGGYYLVGMNRIHKEVFENQTYGHDSVLKNTLSHLEHCKLSWGQIRKLSDLDEKEDVARFRERMRTEPALRKRETGRYLLRNSRISVIVPVYNEETTIQILQRQLLPLRGKCEILFVDGGSTDRTLELLDPAFSVMHSEKGRARQMNLGAMKATGDILFFLHSDSELPENPLAQIRAVMSRYRAGCFGIAFHSRHFFMWTCRVISNHRVKDRKVMFGDQGIFVDRELFFQAGMFPELPIMEDYQFSLTLKEMGVRLGMTRDRLYTSDRRFPRGTIPKLKLMWRMNRLRKMYRDGTPIETISDLYRDVR